jgi:DNA-binding transcriptional ArsR family regulator
MDVEQQTDLVISRIAAAIGEPARVRILYCLLDGHERTSTELAVVADVSPSTASAHLNRLKAERLVRVRIQSKHHYYSLEGPDAASVLEGLSVIAGGVRDKLVPNTPSRLRDARTCYDHMAGRVGVLLRNRFKTLGWLIEDSSGIDNAYDLTPEGTKAFEALNIDLAATRTLRRRFAYACLDWSEREPHIGGALGAALLKTALKRKWVVEDLDSRALSVTGLGRREMVTRFGLHV